MTIKRLTLTAILGVGMSFSTSGFAEEERLHVGRPTLNFSQEENPQTNIEEPYSETVQDSTYENNIPKGAEVQSFEDYAKNKRKELTSKETGISVEKFKPLKISRFEKAKIFLKRELEAEKEFGKDMVQGSFGVVRDYVRETRRLTQASCEFPLDTLVGLRNDVCYDEHVYGENRGLIDSTYKFGKEVVVTPFNVIKIPYHRLAEKRMSPILKRVKEKFTEGLHSDLMSE